MFERFIEERAGRGNQQQSNNGVFESRVTLYNNLNTKLLAQIASNTAYPEPASAVSSACFFFFLLLLLLWWGLRIVLTFSYWGKKK